MRFHPVFFSVSLVLVVAVAGAVASRSALGVVVESCRLHAAWTGSPFPCLKIVGAATDLSAYAILREPTHRERTILTPLAAIAGIEDPRLLAPNGPNYFAYAWDERSVVMDGAPSKDPWLDAALAINPAWNRTQDHLHVHIGCVTHDMKSALQAHEAEIDTLEFRKISTRLHWRHFWVKRVRAESLAEVNPFHVVAAEVPGAGNNMGNVGIGVVGAALEGGERGFYILAEVYPTDQSYGTAEDLLDARCR